MSQRDCPRSGSCWRRLPDAARAVQPRRADQLDQRPASRRRRHLDRHHIQLATANAGSPDAVPAARRCCTASTAARYRRYPVGRRAGRRRRSPRRVVLVGSSGETAPVPVAASCSAAPASPAPASTPSAPGLPWFVLSAKHGLLDPDDVVGPFDLLFGDQSAATARPGPSGSSPSWPTGCRWTAPRSRCTAGSTSPSRSAPLARRGARTRSRCPVLGEKRNPASSSTPTCSSVRDPGQRPGAARPALPGEWARPTGRRQRCEPPPWARLPPPRNLSGG